MLHWSWQPTKLQPSFTGHGMYSGTGFVTKEDIPAAIYHDAGTGTNQIAIANDRRLSAWQKPYPVDVRNSDGVKVTIKHWDPDCFLIGDTYYAISGDENPPLLKSGDLKSWTYVGNFMRHQLPGVTVGEDISCANFIPLGKKWMLLCISHMVGCRYYIGDWDARAEQFVPEQHFFAPESLLSPDGRRVMWAWCATLGQTDGEMNRQTIQSLPRELSLPDDGILRIKPLRELESLRYDPVTLDNITINELTTELLPRSVIRKELERGT